MAYYDGEILIYNVYGAECKICKTCHDDTDIFYSVSGKKISYEFSKSKK